MSLETVAIAAVAFAAMLLWTVFILAVCNRNLKHDLTRAQRSIGFYYGKYIAAREEQQYHKLYSAELEQLIQLKDSELNEAQRKTEQAVNEQ